MTELNKSSVSRRSFLTLGGLAALGAGAALTGCSPQSKNSSSDPTSTSTKAKAPNGMDYPWDATAPTINDSDVEETIDCDVAVIGLGVSGCAAFRAAAEAGAKVVAFEKASTPQCRSSQYAYVNGSKSEMLGLKSDFDLPEILAEEWAECGNITNYDIVKRWLYNHTEAVDWWVEGAGGTFVGLGEEPPATGLYASAMSDATIDYANENQAAYPENLNMSDHQAVLDGNVAKGVAAGGKTYFGHFGEQVIMENGTCVGVYVRNAETKKYKKVNVTKGVVCSMGDGASNPDIMNFFYPEVVANGNQNPWPNTDVEGNNTNTGDVYPLGYWAGAGFSDYQAPMIHVMGGPGDTASQGDSMGFTGPMLRINYNGKRFQNEDVAATECEFSLEQQPKKKMFMIVDSKFEEYSPLCVNTFPFALADYDQLIGDGVHYKGSTLKELFESIEGMNVENALATVERYNGFCATGVDEDYGKKKKYLTPVEEGPFYAVRIGIGLCLCTMGGLNSDSDAHVLTADHEIIPGLYVSGNAQGGRFAVKYPFKLSGTSHCMAMYYGKVAGENAAAGK